jgi:hypothetical protein
MIDLASILVEKYVHKPVPGTSRAARLLILVGGMKRDAKNKGSMRRGQRRDFQDRERSGTRDAQYGSVDKGESRRTRGAQRRLCGGKALRCRINKTNPKINILKSQIKIPSCLADEI